MSRFGYVAIGGSVRCHFGTWREAIEKKLEPFRVVCRKWLLKGRGVKIAPVNTIFVSVQVTGF